QCADAREGPHPLGLRGRGSRPRRAGVAGRLCAAGCRARGAPRRHAPVHQQGLPHPLLEGLHRAGGPRARRARLALRLARHAVASDETREHLVRLGIPGGKVTASGIPIDPVFAEAKDKRAMRQKLGLLADRTIVLLSAGGFGVGPIEHAVASLLELRHPAQVVVVCGRNEELRQRLGALATERAGGSNTLAVVGYTTAMDEAMSAADILVRKPGGLTTSEALAKGLLLVIVK